MQVKSNVNKYFDNVSEDYLHYKYSRGERSFMSVRMERILTLIDRYHPISEGIKVLDAGCGPGNTLSMLARRGYSVTGSDLSKKMLALAAQQLAGLTKWNLVEADIESLPFEDDAFDIVLSAGVIEYLDCDDHALKEFKRVLKKDGLLIIPITNKYSYNLWLDGILELLMKMPFLFNIINIMNKRILGRGGLQHKQFTIRKHSPNEFKKKLTNMNFNIIHDVFFYFMPLPHPLNWFCADNCNILGTMMEKMGRTKFGIIGEGYLVLCQNNK